MQPAANHSLVLVAPARHTILAGGSHTSAVDHLLNRISGIYPAGFTKLEIPAFQFAK